MVTGNDNEKASVGFKAFGLRTEGSCMDFPGLQCVRGSQCVCVCVCVNVDGLYHRKQLRKVRHKLHEGMSKHILFNQIKTEL